MEKLEGVARPMGLLENWLTEFGYDKYRATGADHLGMLYINVQTYEDDEPQDTWHLIGIDDDPRRAIMEGFADLLKMLNKDIGRGVWTLNINGILLVSHGEGRYVEVNADTGEQREIDENDEFLQFLNGRSASFMIPCRMVNAITPSGLAGEVTLFLEDSEPRVELSESWLGDGNETHPQPSGMIEEALTAFLTFAMLSREVISRDLPLNAKSLVDVAVRESVHSSLTGYVLRVVSAAIEAGVLDSEDLV